MSEISLDEYLDKFDDWLAAHPQHERQLEVLRALSDESPRGMVLVLAAELDRLLLELLRAVMSKTKHTEELLNGDGGISTFSARIATAFALQLIEEEEHRDLTLIRKIRNDFAHKLGASFDDQSISNRVRELSKTTDDDADALEKVGLFLILQLQAAIAGAREWQRPPREYGPSPMT